MINNIPRPEHPLPQWERASWKNLNGTWQFDFDFGDSAIEKGLFKNEAKLDKEITVPFCPESKLSGIQYTDFINAVCYKRTVELTETDLAGKLFLHTKQPYISTVSLPASTRAVIRPLKSILQSLQMLARISSLYMPKTM